MSGLTDFLENFRRSFTAAGTAPLPPDPSTLGDYRPNLDGLLRDDQQIIMQYQAHCGEVTGSAANDGGDSAHRVGVAAFCNSQLDQSLLPLFENGHGYMVRHPTQVPWNKTDNCSRDQLKGFSVGCWRAGRTDIMNRLYQAHAARGWFCQNIHAPERCPVVKTDDAAKMGDLLLPHDIMTLAITAGNPAAYLDVNAQLSLYLAILAARNNPEEDNNNLMFESIVCGRLNLFVAAHPNYQAFVRAYWSGPEKQQPQIADAIIDVVAKELERYPPGIDFDVVPEEMIKLMKSLDLSKEIANLNPGHRAELAAQFAGAALRDAANMLTNTMKLGRQEAIDRLNALNPKAAAAQVNKAVEDALSGRTNDAIREAAKTAGVPTPPILPPEPPKPPVPSWAPPAPKVPDPPGWAPKRPKLW